MKYIVHGMIETPTAARVALTTVWFVRRGSRVPFFVTAYPHRRRG